MTQMCVTCLVRFGSRRWWSIALAGARAAQARYVADHVAGSKRVELTGDDFLFFAGDTKPMLDAIEEFVTGGVAVRDDNRVLATVMFTDVVGSTEQLAQHGDRRWQQLLDNHDAVVRHEIERFRGREIHTTGDGFVATFDGPGRAIRCAGAVRDALQELGIRVRIGLHTGEIERRGDDIGGIAVHIAQRIQALAQPGEVLASSTVKDLVAGSGHHVHGPRHTRAQGCTRRMASLHRRGIDVSRARGERKRPSSGWDSLTPTELRIVTLVAAGLTNPQIAERASIARGTVKVHLSHIFAKLSVTTRAELATQATKRGLAET